MDRHSNVKKNLDKSRNPFESRILLKGMLVSISIAARICGVCAKTLRRWETKNKLSPFRTPGGHRRYSKVALLKFLQTGVYTPQDHESTGIAAIYSRVSAVKQKMDLSRQTKALVAKAESDGFTPQVYSDIGSGLNDKRSRFLKLLIDAIQGKFDRLYLTYRDRFARFGTNSYEQIFKALNVPIICLNDKNSSTLENRLVVDVLAVITSFAGKLHRSRRGKIKA